MKRSSKFFLFTMLALAAAFFPNAAPGFFTAGWQQQADEQAEDQESETEYTEEEYNAWEAADKETDPEKRGAKLLEFIEKYPKSKLMSYIDAAYKTLLFECSNSKNYQPLEPLAEKWLMLHPNDIQTLAYIAEAAEKLGHDRKCVESLEAIYALEPSPTMAKNILHVYSKMEDKAKQREWTEKMFQMPEFDADFMMRFDFVQEYTEAKNYAKAAEYAKLTLKAAENVKQPDAQTREQLRKVRRACHHLIGMNAYESGNFNEAIRSLKLAIRAEKYGEGYYYIAMSLWKQDKVEEAMLYFARAEMHRGEVAAQAKDKLEQLYKALHNNTTIGIDKIYRKSKEALLD